MSNITSANVELTFNGDMPVITSTHPDGYHAITTRYDEDEEMWRTYTQGSTGTTELSNGACMFNDFLDDAMGHHFAFHNWEL